MEVIGGRGWQCTAETYIKGGFDDGGNEPWACNRELIGIFGRKDGGVVCFE
jgi:hypothetical protein